MPQLAGLGLDAKVLGFALVLSFVVALVCGAAPAWRAGSVDPQDALRGGRGAGDGRDHHHALRTLVVVEISLSLVLLIGAGLVLKGFAGLLQKDPGFDPSRVLTLNVSASAARYPNGTSIRRLLDPMLIAVRAVPGVSEAAAINVPPYVNWGSNSNIRYEGMPGDDPTRLPLVEQRTITPEFFRVTGQRLIAGRYLTASDDDRPEAPGVVVVNEALVKRDFKGRDAIGKRFHLSDTTFATIVGVVSDVRNAGPVADPQPEMYWTYLQAGFGTSNFPLFIRVRGADPVAVVSGVRSAVRGVDPSAAIADVRAMPAVIASSLGRPRFYFSLLGTFAAIAIVLAMAGLYGVLSYAVAQRTRELGIRLALGSPRARLVALVTRDGVSLVLAGVAFGLAAGFAAMRLMVSMLYGVSPLDAATWALAVVSLFVPTVLATVVPALRASRADPIVAMRVD
jgi:predicted permease